LAVTSTDHVLSASLDGTLALHASSSNSSFSYPSVQSQVPGLTPGARIRTWPAHPLAWVSLSVASINEAVNDEVRKRALVNSMVGTTMLVDFTTGDILGTKAIGEKETGVGTNAGYAEPGALLLSVG
jgi:hypothetical protein